MNFQLKSKSRYLSGRAVRNAALLLLAFTTASCQKNPFQVTESNCPAVSVVSNLGSFTRFNGAGRNTEDVAFNATITGVVVDCTQGDEIDMEVTFAIVARRGSAMSEDSAILPYFLILMRDNHLITVKKIYETTIRFKAGSDRAAVRETVIQRFESSDPARRYDYELLIGFQLTPDEVIYNALR
ncbi:MAG: hypothetical protein IID51_05540 [Proteobacteria bacterium]|nr:hypothetical protein [Pseudomonadota bacterium]